jgi:beta-galactosidase/beta-glucuronidase
MPMMAQLLPTPPGGWAEQSQAVWTHSRYAGQITQALCVEAQAAHFRRGRDTAAQTSGSLFWQLNSEWPGGSKSSLEYSGGWKALHHHAQRFYAPFAASAFLTDRYRNFSVHLANDNHAASECEIGGLHKQPFLPPG